MTKYTIPVIQQLFSHEDKMLYYIFFKYISSSIDNCNFNIYVKAYINSRVNVNIVFLTIIMTLLWTAALLISLIGNGKAHKDCNRYGASGRPVVSHTPRLQVFLNSYQGR